MIGIGVCPHLLKHIDLAALVVVCPSSFKVVVVLQIVPAGRESIFGQSRHGHLLVIVVLKVERMFGSEVGSAERKRTGLILVTVLFVPFWQFLYADLRGVPARLWKIKNKVLYSLAIRQSREASTITNYTYICMTTFAHFESPKLMHVLSLSSIITCICIILTVEVLLLTISL